MTVSGIGISFYFGVGTTDDVVPARGPSTPKTQPQKYFDTSPVQRPDYSYGCSPTSSDGWGSGRSSPSKGFYVPTPAAPEPPQLPDDSPLLTDKERADRALAIRMWGAPWRASYIPLLAHWRAEMGRE